jgi:glutamate/tyrosine decarboxylase-like PLP-dependent enzyme
MSDAAVPALRRAAALAETFLDELPDRPVAPPVDLAALRAALGKPLADEGLDAETVIEELARDMAPGITATAGPRYYGFVIGGTLPSAVAADWLVSTWDQPTAFHVMSPASAVIEDVAGAWVLDLLGLPAGASVGFATGAQGANVVGLAAGRQAVLARAGWDVHRQGLQGAPRVRVLTGGDAHVTIYVALRLLGLGTETAERVEADDQGRMRPEALRAALAAEPGVPAIVCAQAGNVNTGAFDPLEEIAGLAREHGAWLHVDGAFGLWAAASPELRHLTAGAERADSWAIDAHKWLNVPYDCAMAIVADRAAHESAMAMSAAYLTTADGAHDPTNLVVESSRRARAVPVYAAIRELGRGGVADLVERCCAHARRFAELLGAEPGVEVLNDVVLNQVLVRFGDDERTLAVVEAVQREGTLWLGSTVYGGRAAMRISVSNWRTTAADVERSAAAILSAVPSPAGG